MRRLLGGCIITPTEEVGVTVADGSRMLSHGKCPQFTWTLQGETFSTDMRLLKFGGCDVVLGIQWLKKLSSVNFDFQKMTLSFKRGNKIVCLQGAQDAVLYKLMSMKAITKEMQQGACGMVMQLSSLEISSHDNDMPELLLPLLQQYSELFEEPLHLPPTRALDHAIPLKAGSEPVNKRPYRCPHFQKTEIESIMAKLLQHGVIQRSTSPFISPVILVKKKYGT